MKGVRGTARREVGVPPCPPPMHYVVCWGSWLDSMCAPRDAGINPQLLGCKQVLVPPNQPFGVCPSPPPPTKPLQSEGTAPHDVPVSLLQPGTHLCLISGMLMQLAAATAAKGT